MKPIPKRDVRRGLSRCQGYHLQIHFITIYILLFGYLIYFNHNMVLLRTTATLKAAVDEYLRLHADCENSEPLQHQLERLEKAELDGPIEHSDVIDISKRLVKECRGSDTSARTWRLDTLLKGTTVYQPPPPPKPEPVG